MDSNTTQVSVIIQLYNKVSYIKRALYSVLMQTGQDFEECLVNDVSKDSGEKIVEENTTDTRIHLINQDNQSVSATPPHNEITIPHIMVAITTYNRKSILEMFAKSFNNIDGLENLYICVFDDCSSEYDEKYLKQIFKKIDYVHVNEKNLGADRNASQCYVHFVQSGCEWLLNADSDLIFNKDIISIITEISHRSMGIFSVFNTPNHNVIDKYDDIFVEKASFGAAGVVINKQIAKLIIENIGANVSSFDWDFCEYLGSHKIKLLVTRNSLCQHIGFYGQNSLFRFDYGIGYEPDSQINSQIIENLCENIFCNSYNIVSENLNIMQTLSFIRHLIVVYVKNNFLNMVKHI